MKQKITIEHYWRVCFSLAASAACLIATQPSHAYMEGYTPLSASDLKRKVKLTPVDDAGLKEGKTLKIGPAEMMMPAEGNDIIFSGRDKKGKPWTLTKTYYGLGTSFFTKDLDCNGTTDIILLQATGGCGIAPPAVLTFILFDKDFRPFPMEMSGYASDYEDRDKKKTVEHIDDLITLGADNRAVLIGTQLDSAQLKNKYGSFWRILLYRANNGRWERITKYKNMNVPMIVRYTSKPNAKVIPNPVASLKTFEDGAFGRAEEKQSLTSKVKNVELEENRVKSLKIEPNLSLDPEGSSFFHPFIIKDRADKYEIIAMGSDAGESVMKTLAGKKVRFSKLGVSPKPPLFLWLLE